MNVFTLGFLAFFSFSAFAEPTRKVIGTNMVSVECDAPSNYSPKGIGRLVFADMREGREELSETLRSDFAICKAAEIALTNQSIVSLMIKHIFIGEYEVEFVYGIEIQ